MALCGSSACFVAPAAQTAGPAPALRASAAQPPADGSAGAGLASALVLAAATGSASVASRRRARKPASAVQAFESELGVQPPTGFWDPAGYTNDGDAQNFYRRRCVELKHGRVSMLACIGYIVPEYFKWPGYLSPSDGIKFADIPHGLEAITRVPAVGWTQVVFFGLGMELFGANQDPTKPPGKLSSRLVVGLTEIKNKSLAGGIRNEGYEFGPFGIPNAPSIADPELRKKKLNAELANGRLAMVAIMGMMFQNGTVGTTGPEMWLGAGALPKSMEGTGGPFPDDVWDPLGLSVGKSEEQLLRWRAVELKHGRVAMLAVIGWIHVALGYHLVGDWATRGTVSNNPLVNVTQLPIGGAFQLVFAIMCFEWLTTYVCKPPKDAPWDIFGWSEIIAYPDDPKWKERQLQELNNGRLAMVAFVGLVAQTLATGDFGVSGLGEIQLADGAPWPDSPGFESGRFRYPEVGGNVGYATGPAKELGQAVVDLFDNATGRGQLIVKAPKAPV